MIILAGNEVHFLSICLEGFFYGKISILCALICTPVKEVQSFPAPGLYSGIFIIYLHNQLNNLNRDSRRAIIFYALCILYVLSTVTFLADFVQLIFDVSNNSICKNIIFYQLCRRFFSIYNLTQSYCPFTFQLSKS